MPLFRTADEATRNSILAVILCVLGTVVGLATSALIAAFTSLAHLPLSGLFITVFALLVGHWVLRHRTKNYDPSATFVTYMLGLSTSFWILHFFFVAPSLGPFAEQFWTVPVALTNTAFGVGLFVMIGSTVGMTYYAARRSYAESSARRALYALIGVGLPIAMLVQAEVFITRFCV